MGIAEMGADLLHIAQLAAARPAEFLIASFWQGLVLASFAWLALKVVRTAAPKTRFLLWMIVFVLAALMPIATLLHRSTIANPAVHGAAHFPAAHLDADWALALVILWTSTSLFSLARLTVSAYKLHRLARTATPIAAEGLSQDLRAGLKRANTGERANARAIELRLSGRVDSPIVIGFFRPVILVPEWLWEKLTSAEKSQVVTHELAHLDRRDDWTNLLQKLFCALFPLNPALAWVERQLCREREMACDDAVLGAVTPREYAACLTNMAEKRLMRHVQSLAPGAWRRRSELAERVHRILKSNRALSSLSAKRVIVGFAALSLCAGIGLTHSPSLVTVLPPAPSRVLSAHGTGDSKAGAIPVAQIISGDQHGLLSPRVEQASFRTDVSRTSVLPRKASPKAHRAVVTRHALITRRSRVADALFVEAAQPAPPAPKLLGRPRIVLTVFEISPSLPALPDGDFSPSQFTVFRSAGSWIIIQL